MRQHAVDSFLGSMDLETPGYVHMLNLQLDTKLYDWDRETVLAIKEGIKKKYTYYKSPWLQPEAK